MVKRSRLRDRSGFTLVEAIVAAVLGAFVIAMVTSVVVSQTRSNVDVSARAAAIENTRLVADLMLADLGSVTRGGMLEARADRLQARVLLAMGVVCGGGGKDKGKSLPTPVFLPFPMGNVDAERVSGYGYRDGDSWTYLDSTWEGMLLEGNSAELCEDHGGDPDGGGDDYRFLGTKHQAADPPGKSLALFSLVELSFGASALRPGTQGLFRSDAGGTAVELVSGLTDASRFQYRRTGSSAWEDQVTGGGNLQSIQEIRVTLVAYSGSEASGETYERELRILFRNVP